MGVEGARVLEAYRYVRDFLKQVALLLKTSDELMADRGWVCPHGSTATSFGSYSLDGSGYWIPREAFRFYVRKVEAEPEEQKDREIAEFCNVSILIDDYGRKYRGFREPMLCGGYFALEPPRSPKQLGTSYYNFVEFLGRRGVGQEPVEWRPGKKDKAYFARMVSFGRPLVAVEKSEDLERLIIDPLVKLAPE